MDKLVLKNIYNKRGELILKKGVNIYKVQEIHRFLAAIGAFDTSNGEDAIYISTQNRRDEENLLKQFHKNKNSVLFKHIDNATDIINKVIHASDHQPWQQYMNALLNHIDWLYSHSINVALIAGLMGLKMKFEEEILMDLIVGALLHDIGNILLPKEIVQKKEEYGNNDYEIIQKHPELGFHLLEKSDISNNARLIVLQHHERIDGSGYPGKLTDTDILLLSQIVGIADSLDSATSYRSYKERKSLEEAMKDLMENPAYNTYLVEKAIDIFT